MHEFLTCNAFFKVTMMVKRNNVNYFITVNTRVNSEWELGSKHINLFIFHNSCFCSLNGVSTSTVSLESPNLIICLFTPNREGNVKNIYHCGALFSRIILLVFSGISGCNFLPRTALIFMLTIVSKLAYLTILCQRIATSFLNKSSLWNGNRTFILSLWIIGK